MAGPRSPSVIRIFDIPALSSAHPICSAAGEFERYRQAILRDSSQLAEQANKIPSVDTLNFLMESIACGHTVMSHRDAHDAMMQVRCAPAPHAADMLLCVSNGTRGG